MLKTDFKKLKIGDIVSIQMNSLDSGKLVRIAEKPNLESNMVLVEAVHGTFTEPKCSDYKRYYVSPTLRYVRYHALFLLKTQQ